MTDTDTFAAITSDDVRPGETPAQARTRRKTEANRQRRQAAKPAAKTPRKTAAKPKADKAPSSTPPADPLAAAADAVKAPPKGPGKPSNRDKRAQAVVEVTTIVGTIWGAFVPEDGVAVIEGGPALGDALAKIAERKPAVARVLDGGLDATGYAELAIAVLAIAAPIARNHGAFGLAARPAPAVPPQPAPSWGVVDDFGLVTPMPATVTPEGGFQAVPDGGNPEPVAGYVPPGVVPDEYVAAPWLTPFQAR